MLIDRPEQFTFTAKHLALMRELIVVWNSLESGAPIIYIRGAGDPYARLAKTIGMELRKEDIEDRNLAARRFETELRNAFQIFIQFARLTPGSYSYQNPLSAIRLERTRFRINAYTEREVVIPSADGITFDFKSSHRTLLENASADWFDYARTVGIDPKRPYGDRTFYELDMADILNVPYTIDNRKADISKAHLEELQSLHEEMWFALQTFLIYAHLDPAEYRRGMTGIGLWERHL